MPEPVRFYKTILYFATMKKAVLPFILLLSLVYSASAQSDDYGNVQQGEFGFTIGAAHYFGDLNTRAKLNRPKIALGAFYRKQFNNYLALRISAHYAKLGYSDTYSDNSYQIQRNLSFNSDILEFAVHGDFNFFKYIPGDPYHSFTPFVTIGLGLFSYNPYAYLNNEKVYLRPLGTEGQNVGFLGRKPYGSSSLCIPIGIGLKYSVNSKVNFMFQIAQRLTMTDYLDDISTSYAGPANFPDVNGQPSVANQLQDRSFPVLNRPTRIGDLSSPTNPVQRGWSKQKDQYIIAEIGFSFNISSYVCPSAY